MRYGYGRQLPGREPAHRHPERRRGRHDPRLRRPRVERGQRPDLRARQARLPQDRVDEREDLAHRRARPGPDAEVRGRRAIG
ncbi:hypothetical protein SVTN_08965 [Streptomyces vietnamensis]|uniref:Uncharacterized protein n=1 Tax=Streptomyces vietnamensis TaxID=362257 RepID=A0A0B5I8H3_9ACTN|nr:hypothetical protein SVTN_08965 [Streptomyces vietnamensis]